MALAAVGCSHASVGADRLAKSRKPGAVSAPELRLLGPARGGAVGRGFGHSATVLIASDCLRFGRVTDLQVHLESELPPELSVGLGTALFVNGWCFCADSAISELWFEFDGEAQPVAAFGMPRLDPFRAHHPTLDPFAVGTDLDLESNTDPELRSYRSGFWGLVKVSAQGPGRSAARHLSLVARTQSGERIQAELGRLAPGAPESPSAVDWPEASARANLPRVAIAMATHNPPPALLRAQLASIRAQTHQRWVCVISDDASSPHSRALLEQLTGDDPRFELCLTSRHLGFYGNFERALSLVPDDADFIALADQDDVWHSDKLEVLLAAIGDRPLVYSDARVVSADGRVLAETWWEHRRNNHDDILSLLVANAVSGSASLFRADLRHYALPFPPAQFAHFHDHWLGLVAACLGEIGYVPRPLYDYVQHGHASLGHAGANRMPSLRDRARQFTRLHERVQMWRLHYFVDVWRCNQFATVLLMRCADRMPRRKRRALERFLRAERSWPVTAALAVRGARELVGTPETLGAEWMLAHAFLWRRLLSRTVRDRPQNRLRLDALPPSTLIQPPGRLDLPESARSLRDKVAPLRWAVSIEAPERINLLIPTIDLRHLFGGYIAKFNLARRLAQTGARVRIVTVDPVGALPADWRAAIESYAGLAGLFDEVEVAFGREAGELDVSSRDRFIATTWWTAHIAGSALEAVRAERFLYLIQEYEPFTFAMGAYAAAAAQSYALPHAALFSSELLRGYFRNHGIGVYSAGHGDDMSLAFENAITPVPPPSTTALGGRATRRLLFYARPEPHAARNMFELGVVALAQAVAEGDLLAGWELNGIGSVTGESEISLGAAKLKLLPRTGQQSYADVLGEHDVGLALMYTPHPSLVPIEMAAAGMVTVTNRFENKTREAMAAISANLIAAPPTPQGIVDGLRAAITRSADVEARVAASAVHWSSRWEDSFSRPVLDRLLELLVGG